MLIGIDARNLEGNRTGVGRYLFNLLKMWAQLAFMEFFHTTEYDKNPLPRFALYFKDEVPKDLPQSPLFEAKLLNVGSTAKFIHWDLWRQAKKDKVDILFCPAYIAPIFWRGKLALTLHDIIYEAHPEWFEWKSWMDKILLKWVSIKSAEKAGVIFVPSEFTRQEVIRHYKVRAEKVILVYLAADFGYTSPQPSPYQGEGVNMVKKRFHIKDKFAFFVASIFERRHLPEVISAFLKLECADYQLLIGGRDYTISKKVDAMSKAINRQLGREAILRVDFISDSDLRLLYSACAFFIWLSDYEGFGLPPLEAMSCGAPVITSDSTSLKEVAGNAALLIKNNSDVEEIYQAMKRLVEDGSLCQELIRRERGQAGKFSWESCAKITLEQILHRCMTD